MADVYLDIIGRTNKVASDLKNNREQLKQLGQESEKVNQKMQSGFENTAKTVRNLAAQLGIAFGAMQVINYLKQMAGEAIKFEKTLANVYTQLTKIEKQQYREPLKKGSLETMAKYGLTIEEVNGALFEAISAGVKVGESLEFIDKAAKLAVGGVASLDVVVDGATSVMNAYGYSVDELEKITSAFFTSQKYGKTTVAELAQEIGTILPVARAAGVGYKEILAAFGLLTKQGINTAETATALRATLVSIAAPSNEAAKIFKQLGIETGLVALKQNGLGKTLLQVAKASEGNADVLTQLIPNVRALSAVAALGTEALTEYERILKEINIDHGEGSSLEQAYEEMMKSTEKSLDKLKATIRKLWIESDVMEGSLKGVATASTVLANDLGKEDGLIKRIVSADKTIAKVYSGTIPNLIMTLYQLLSAEKETSEQTGDSTEEIDKQKKAYEGLETAIGSVYASLNAYTKGGVKPSIETINSTINSLKLKITELEKQQGELNVTNWDGHVAINRQIEDYQRLIKFLQIAGKETELKKIKPIEVKVFGDLGIDIIGKIPILFDKSIKEVEDRTKKLAINTQKAALITGEDVLAAEAELQEKRIALINGFANTAMAITDLIAAKNQAAMDQELVAAEGNEKKQEEIRKKYARKGQSIAVSQALISGALAVMDITSKWAAEPPVMYVLIALQAIQTALQVATIKAQKFSKGVLDLKGSGNKDSILSMLAPHETVMTAKETRDYMPYLKAMKEGVFPRFDLDIAKQFEKNTYNNLNYDNSKEISKLEQIRLALNKRPSDSEFLQGSQRIVKKGNVTTRINLN